MKYTPFRDMLEALRKIYFKDKEFKWNPNKTEQEFKDRIKQRTKLSESEFFDIIQKGINKSKIPIDSSICLYFLVSKFVLILNTKEMIITTIRDGKWDKPGNSCKNLIISNEDATKMEQFELDYLNEQLFFKIEVNENFDVILESTCNFCIKVDL